MADEKVVELLEQVLMQMERQQQALVSLTGVLDNYLSVPIKVDASSSPVSFKEGSTVGINNKPTVAAEQSGAWNVGVANTPAVKSARQNWEFMILRGAAINGVEEADKSIINKFITQINTLGADGWELTNITGYPLLVASFKRPK